VTLVMRGSQYPIKKWAKKMALSAFKIKKEV